MSIFQDESGHPIKFFIQKDLPEDAQADLSEKITSLGGRIEQKVPRQGYILVQFGSQEEVRLSLCWKVLDRPDRFFVPYTFVDACARAGMLIKQIFVHEGKPIAFHIHNSIANVNTRAELSDAIRHSGGDPTATSENARVIIADPETEVFNHLVKTYQGIAEKYIESLQWIGKCIRNGVVAYTPTVYKNPGGRRAGEERTQFTSSDEQHLCEWIAAKIPYKETGGRTGNRLYQQLCDMAPDPEYFWVTRHTWQSWRERYKKNSARLDAMIASIVDQRRPVMGEKGQYAYVRASEEPVKKQRRIKRQRTPEQEPLAGPSAQGSVHMPMLETQPLMYPHPVPASYLPPPGTGPMDPSPAMMKDEDNSLGTEDVSDWNIRVGNEPTPPWARKNSIDREDGIKDSRKRARCESEVNPSVRIIADRFRFTWDEVYEYYNKVRQDLPRTERRFEKMRMVLTNLSDEE